MEITFQQYIDNPLGKKSAVYGAREVYKALYTKKYGAVLLRENGTFNTVMYYDKKSDRHFIHMKVPSEVVKDFYYDVVVEFYPISIGNKTDPTLRNYGVRFFSNDPAFVFTYEYVFSKNDLLIKELKPRASKVALRNKPDERNPYLTPGYVKSLYFCFLHMQSRSLFNKVHWKNYAQPFSAKVLVASVEDSDKKVAERQELGKETERKKYRDKLKQEKQEKIEKAMQPSVKRIRGPQKSDNTVKKITPKKPKASTRLGGINTIKKK